MIRKQLVHLFSAILAVTFAAVSLAPSHAATIAHWSFDTPTLTTDAGDGHILTAADATGAHNATTRINGTGRTINSVAGQFGQAADFTNVIGNQGTNNAYMDFPQLTEIAGPSGGSFTVAAWAKVPAAATTDDLTILADWGNAPANTNRFTYWFELDNADSNANSRPRAQLRWINVPPSPALPAGQTQDIVATTLGATNNAGVTDLADDAWHHLAWVWDKPATTMHFYVDGVLALSQLKNAGAPSADVLVSDSPVGAIGGKRDNNRYFVGAMDEVWVIGRALSDFEVATLRTTNIVIPEPSSVLLVLLGVLPFGFGIRHRK